ncbi:MAG: glycoside hydrolase family 15 protein [Paraglaciecola sp.]|uniref:glycoside hydrolase family 15 protein n=1 Tax=Pseudomonadati TaxID=3379134 RepID=UPI00273E1CCF|nr:glycoside hydrolase family 15 protein [Paraglaciecola sp.]MDP5030601.1 glycoside hydrolase family 15 protein [Paraglaciecola sp.]MDP5129678.1 glycoside hydrolase family 15 protein [Paraglaciecola sp.]
MRDIELTTSLDAYYRQIKSVIIDKQHPISGLLPASTAITNHGNYQDAWVRDNVYSILAVWGLALAYRQLDNDGGRGVELEQRTVKLMRGLLRSMMSQSAKVEAFKKSRSPLDSLHAKYDTATGENVVADDEWGHLQIDATSVFLLMMTQMITSGLNIIWTDEEVCFVQNLVYYIERAYRTPDYGIWERGAKSNSGSVELNASSLGMAKAALEALSGFNLFGAKGSQSSVLHVIPDNIAQANITLTAMLPRESNTKEIDAALLSVIGFPAFTVPDSELANKVRNDIISKLEGRYGLKRFLRDGHQTELEDEARLHYEEQELKQFEHIESEWPLFYAYLYLDAIFREDRTQIDHYRARLDAVLVEQDGYLLLPELYYVPLESIELEKKNPGSQDRLPNENVPLVWAQSLFLLGAMLEDGLLRPGDLDPLGRRHAQPLKQPVVQLIFLAEDQALQEELATFGVSTETLSDIAPVQVCRPEDIANVHSQVGRCDSLGLSGRTYRVPKSLTTSRIYMLEKSRVVCLTPSFMQQAFFLSYDIDFLVRRFKSELRYLQRNWTELGRPTVTVLLTKNLLDADRTTFFELMKQVEGGEVDGIAVKHGKMAQLSATASVERIGNLHGFSLPDMPLEQMLATSCRLNVSAKHSPLSPSQALEIDLCSESQVLIGRLAQANNIFEQIALLSALVKLQNLDALVDIDGGVYSLRDLIEEVYCQAGRLRVWSVLRAASGLLGKSDGDLGLAVSALLVAQKIIQVGRSYSDDSLISRPLQDDELLTKIQTYCREDARDQILTQEVLLCLGLLIKARPELFSELLTIRVSHLIMLLTSQIARADDMAPDEAYECLMAMPPSVIQERLEAVLENYQSLADLPQKMEQLHAKGSSDTLHWQQNLGLERLVTPVDGWLAWRQHQGIIDRRSAAFNEQIWLILHHTTGLVIGNKMDKRNRIHSSIVLSDMTPGEAAFALLTEHMLNNIQAAEYRQLTIEALTAVASFFAQNPSLIVDEAIVVDVAIGHAVNLAYLKQYPERASNYTEYKSHAWECFYALSPLETSAFIVSALSNLLTVRTGGLDMMEQSDECEPIA